MRTLIARIRQKLDHPFWWLMVLCIPAFIWNLGRLPLMADEPIRALVALEMELSGNYLVPHVNGTLYLNKPPLYNWILLGIFKISGSHSEWIIRLPGLLALFGMMWTIYQQMLRMGQNRELAFLCAFAFATGGNLLFYSSLLGHIDVPYAWLTMGSFFVIYNSFERQQWWRLFMLSWIMAAAGFMLKGMPSILFQGFTLLYWFIAKKEFKRLFGLASIAGFVTFILIVGSYFVLYHQEANAFDYLRNLWTESSKRTVVEKSFWQSISHIFQFPLDFIRDTLPWGLGLAMLLNRKFRSLLTQNTWLRFCLGVFLVNIVVYWLSPDNRARYLFMLIPLFIIPFLSAFYRWMEDLEEHQMRWINTALQSLIRMVALTALVVLLLFSWHLPLHPGDRILLILLVFLAIIFDVVFLQERHLWWAKILFILLGVRIIFNTTVIPQRSMDGSYVLEKQQALEIAAITGNEPLAMYHSNVHLNMSWYMTLAKQQIIPMKTTGFQLEEWYLCPADVLHDPGNEIVHYEFVRRFEQKPFKLLKFRTYFPEMPKHPTKTNESNTP